MDRYKAGAGSSKKYALKGGRYVMAGAISFFVAVAWMIWGVDYATELLKNNSVTWFGKPWYELSSLVYSPLLFLIFVPAFSSIGLFWWFLTKAEELNRPIIVEVNLQGLAKAKVALQQGLSSLDKIESEVRAKMAMYEKLQKQLDELSTVKDLNVEQLQKKLNAIAIATRGKTWLGRASAYFLGIVSSVFSSYVWELISKG